MLNLRELIYFKTIKYKVEEKKICVSHGYQMYGGTIGTRTNPQSQTFYKLHKTLHLKYFWYLRKFNKQNKNSSNDFFSLCGDVGPSIFLTTLFNEIIKASNGLIHKLYLSSLTEINSLSSSNEYDEERQYNFYLAGINHSLGFSQLCKVIYKMHSKNHGCT